jgi:hypothetical protein
MPCRESEVDTGKGRVLNREEEEEKIELNE